MYTRLALNSQDYEVTRPLIERRVCHLFSATEPGSAAVASTWQRWKRTQLISPPFTTLHRFYPGQHQPPASSRDLCSACSALATEAWKWGSVAGGGSLPPFDTPPQIWEEKCSYKHVLSPGEMGLQGCIHSLAPRLFFL